MKAHARGTRRVFVEKRRGVLSLRVDGTSAAADRPRRPVTGSGVGALGAPLPAPGLSGAARLLHRGGLLVCNALDEARDVARTVRALFPASVRIAIEGYDNAIVVGGPGSLSALGLRAAAAADPLLRETLPRLSFRTGG